jgi:hypothetical protein
MRKVRLTSIVGLVTSFCPCVTCGKTWHRLHYNGDMSGYEIINVPARILFTLSSHAAPLYIPYSPTAYYPTSWLIQRCIVHTIRLLSLLVHATRAPIPRLHPQRMANLPHPPNRRSRRDLGCRLYKDLAVSLLLLDPERKGIEIAARRSQNRVLGW